MCALATVHGHKGPFYSMESPIDLATRMALQIIVRWDIDWNGLALKLGHVAMCFYSSLSSTMDEFT